MSSTKEELHIKEEVLSGEKHFLILFNDEHNTFEHVTESLIRICKHDEVQAEQCATIAHFKGKCDIKTGTYPTLKPMKEALIECGLSATIESLEN